MRLWTLHPRYLDSRGLVALWREALLAQAVLKGLTRGYTRHPQLKRFQQTPSPTAAIAGYLQGVHAEALHRGYAFDATKFSVAEAAGYCGPMLATRGQLDYEWTHLREKLRVRAPDCFTAIESLRHPDAHPDTGPDHGERRVIQHFFAGFG